MRQRFLIFSLSLFLIFTINAQTVCDDGYIQNLIWENGEVMQYANLFGQTFEVPECVTRVHGIDIDFVGTHYKGVARLWSGNACTGANPTPIAEFEFGTENGSIGTRNSWEFIPFGSSGFELPGAGTYTITFQMEGLIEGFHYDDRAKYTEGSYIYFQLGTWSEFSGADLFFRIHLSGEQTDVGIDRDIPSVFKLEQNYPNPFNPSTTIKYSIPVNLKSEMLNTKLCVYDILGKEVATLVDEVKQVGNYEVVFNATNLPSGVYLYQLQTGNFIYTKKLTLLK